MEKLKLNLNDKVKNIINSLNNLTQSVDEAYKHVPQGKEFTQFIISRIEDGKNIDGPEKIIDDLKDILNIIKTTNQAKSNLIVQALFNLGGTQEQVNGFMEILNNFDELCDCGIKSIIDTKIKYTINYIHKLNESAPSIEGYINAKKPRKKSQDQIDSENIAKEIWAKDKMLSIEYVAKEIIFKLDLSKSLPTVKGWIKPIDPLLGTGIKRKRRSNKK
ncbi:hypothetical protein NMU80_01420 [Pasteurella multocida]|uniref:hypothetical protein n=1 Tax=Pasteurella multocida TaxID=747 RepID=UPI002A55FCB4|nr:hypothetical protein [Pasteurella multocida]MDY0458197.1 hypothetical protein [Pasteurella multocida]MDY0471581.1 hypothetical protein [Pasteurella multocida]MDY0482853.1 hypothetical protein [Pasteurella multocida]MDY0489742.1 hypothetical protein [Pasteurella multocida]MDY0491828.1 hypothetical protein [Pasteurella multocida]